MYIKNIKSLPGKRKFKFGANAIFKKGGNVKRCRNGDIQFVWINVICHFLYVNKILHVKKVCFIIIILQVQHIIPLSVDFTFE